MCYITVPFFMEMRFGKYRGEEISDLPMNYLEWLLTEDRLEGDEREEAFTGIALRVSERYSRMRRRTVRKPPARVIALDAVTQREAK